MKIQELAPMSVEQYVAQYLPASGLAAELYPDPMKLFQPTIEAVKKLAFAPYFWFIVDYTTLSIVDIAPDVEHHMAQNKEAWLAKGPEITIPTIHPDDIDLKFAYDHFNEKYLGAISPERRRHLKFNMYYRIMDRKGSYRWYMAQMPDYHYDSNGNIIYALRVVYDISHIKKDGVPMMTLLDDTDPQNQVFLCHSSTSHQPLIDKLLRLTDRELQVVRLLAGGQLSKQIAGNLGISPNTVENHKQNIFRKTETRSANELVAFAIRSGIA